jgi:sugar/nucleoside kinase (ribokinase family)
MTVAIVGSTTIDTIAHQGRRIFKLGGVTTYSGMTYARQGVQCMLVSNVANRDRHLLRPLANEDLILHLGKSRHTTRFVNHIDGDRRRQEMPAAADPIEWRQLAGVIGHVEILHLGPLHPKDIAHEVYPRLSTCNAVAVLDVQGMVRCVKNHQVLPEVSTHLPDALKACAIVKADELELQILKRFFKMGVSNLMADFEIQELVVTAGQKGGYVLTADGETVSYASVPIQSVADPTGAGDVFFASYVTRRLIQHLCIAESCQEAAAVAASLVAGKFIRPQTLMLTQTGSSG